jgi:chemotaxis protein MotA
MPLETFWTGTKMPGSDLPLTLRMFVQIKGSQMNFSSLLGVLAAAGVFLVSVFTATPAREIFLDPHGILIVVGGTMAASLLCFPLSTFLTAFKVVVKKFLGRYGHRHERVIAEIVDLSKLSLEDETSLSSKVETVKTEFLKEALQLMLDGGLTAHQLDSVLRKRNTVMFKKHQKEAGVFKTIAKFPPAFGLMGTTIGMIALLQSLGSSDAYKTLGPSMAIGLVATLYGITLANFVFIPIGENLTKLNEEDMILREIVIDGIKLLRAKEHPLLVEEYLKSYLSPSERKLLKQRSA